MNQTITNDFIQAQEIQEIINESLNMQIETINYKPKKKCGFPATFISGLEEPQNNERCQDLVVDTLEIEIENDRTFIADICQHHANIISIMYDKKKLGQMAIKGEIRGIWL
jgi:hypothetical protein